MSHVICAVINIEDATAISWLVSAVFIVFNAHRYHSWELQPVC